MLQMLLWYITNPPITKVLILVAMTHESLAMVSTLGLSPLDHGLPAPLKAFHKKVTSPPGEVLLVINGQRKVNNLDGSQRTQPTGEPVTVEGVSVVPAAIAAWEAIRYFKPSLVISAGTCGGVKHKTQKGKVYVANAPVVYHDRLINFRLPGDTFEPNNYQAYGIGSFNVQRCPKMQQVLGLLGATLTSGSSFDPCHGNVLEQFNKSGATIKEMEAAAVAEIAQLLGVPFIAVKGVTDYINHPDSVGVAEDAPWNDQFEKELAPVSEIVANTMVKVIDFVIGKQLADL